MWVLIYLIGVPVLMWLVHLAATIEYNMEKEMNENDDE